MTSPPAPSPGQTTGQERRRRSRATPPVRALRLLQAAAALLVWLLASRVALAQGGPDIGWCVIANGGAPSSGGAVAVNDTLGQPFIGQPHGGAAALSEGFWHAGMGPAPPGATVAWWVLANGGAPSWGGAVTFNDTLGQPFIGPSQVGTTGLRAGYWHSGLTPVLGDVNQDGLVNSTDALIILSADVGLSTWRFCPMNCGDANADGLVNSTDAAIVLTYDVGISVPFPLGQTGCPASVALPAGCTP
jgi:hypothetical protein